MTSYELVKEAFLTRGDDFSDRITDAFGLEFTDGKDGKRKTKNNYKGIIIFVNFNLRF